MLDLKHLFPFSLDQFQQDAIAAVDADKSVVVCAPTGSGKTLIGEYAIYRALDQGKRVFYTTPLKALSNQKFRDFQQRFDSPDSGLPQGDVGLITGDIVINPGAAIVVMTTEIFRNMLYETPIGQVGTSLEDVATVILDECHYISDKGRGTVWEESIIYCPPTIQLVALSATIGNAHEFTDWINQIRNIGKPNVKSANCELINSDFRPIPLRYYFSSKQGLTPLLNDKQTKLNPRLKPKGGKGVKVSKKRLKREECPTLREIVTQLHGKDMLPAIYVIFSRRGCDQAVEQLYDINLVTEEEGDTLEIVLAEFLLASLINKPEQQELLLKFFADRNDLQQLLLSCFAQNPDAIQDLRTVIAENRPQRIEILEFLANNCEIGRVSHLEPLTRGIAAHHAGILPAWKELVEQLFEAGLVKVVFATATLAAGINMPARTTVISALSKRTDSGHQMLTPSEFFQIAGRAGRRGLDVVGHVVTVQTPFEGATDAAFLATAAVEPLKSCFAPSYGMVLNLLQKHTIDQAKDLLERSFAEYLAQKKLIPQQQAIAQLTTELTKLDIELAAISEQDFQSYEKIREHLKEEQRILDTLKNQAEVKRKREIAPLLPQINPGQILYLKGKHIRVAHPLSAVLIGKTPGSGQLPDLICLGSDNRWYIATNADIFDLHPQCLPEGILTPVMIPDVETGHLGKWLKGDTVTAIVSDKLKQLGEREIPIEIISQEAKVNAIKQKQSEHSLNQYSNPGHLIKRHQHRLLLREQLYQNQNQYQKHQSRRSYYWQEFLNLIEVLREFQALDGFNPTYLGEAAATIRGDNELWLSLALMSGDLESLEPQHLAAVVGALIMETPRPDSWTNYLLSPEVAQILNNLQKTRQELIKIQHRYDIAMPVWLERDLISIVEQWALGIEWAELCQNTSLDEGDIVRLIRRTIDILWQIPQIPGIPGILIDKAKYAIAQMKRFPV